MKQNPSRSIACRSAAVLATAAIALATPTGAAQTSDELEQLKVQLQQLQRTVDSLNDKIAEMEAKETAAPPVVRSTNLINQSASYLALEKVADGGSLGQRSGVVYRGALDDRQFPAARPRDFTLDPKYRGYIPIPNTPALIRFNAKPRFDIVSDNIYSGNTTKFLPVLFPLKGDPAYGGGAQTAVTANGTQLDLDFRAPGMPGDMRFFYQNDFYGSSTKQMQYRLRHLYGQYYGLKAGFTYGLFEDPDVWPDTVDYAGPNGALFVRRPVGHYTASWNDNWHTTFGVESPELAVDTTFNPGASQISRIPDLGVNTRFEKEGFGHVQGSAIFRDIGVSDPMFNDQHVLGWGVNLSGGFDLPGDNSLQLLGVYGQGVGSLGNDTGNIDSDAAFMSNGELQALPYWSFMCGFTHNWSKELRSTVSYGYAELDPTDGQAQNFYRHSHYGSVNLVWNIYKRLNLGFEGLYGILEAQSGVDSGNHWRGQTMLSYSLF